MRWLTNLFRSASSIAQEEKELRQELCRTKLETELIISTSNDLNLSQDVETALRTVKFLRHRAKLDIEGPNNL